MKRALIAAAVLSLAFAAPVLAADAAKPAGKPAAEGAPAPKAGKEAGDNFGERKASLLKRIDDRINGMQNEKKCIKAAKNQDELRNCRGGRRGGDGEERRGRGKRRDGAGAPGAPASKAQAPKAQAK